MKTRLFAKKCNKQLTLLRQKKLQLLHGAQFQGCEVVVILWPVQPLYI